MHFGAWFIAALLLCSVFPFKNLTTAEGETTPYLKSSVEGLRYSVNFFVHSKFSSLLLLRKIGI